MLTCIIYRLILCLGNMSRAILLIPRISTVHISAMFCSLGIRVICRSITCLSRSITCLSRSLVFGNHAFLCRFCIFSFHLSLLCLIRLLIYLALSELLVKIMQLCSSIISRQLQKIIAVIILQFRHIASILIISIIIKSLCLHRFLHVIASVLLTFFIELIPPLPCFSTKTVSWVEGIWSTFRSEIEVR